MNADICLLTDRIDRLERRNKALMAATAVLALLGAGSWLLSAPGRSARAVPAEPKTKLVEAEFIKADTIIAKQFIVPGKDDKTPAGGFGLNDGGAVLSVKMAGGGNATVNSAGIQVISGSTKSSVTLAATDKRGPAIVMRGADDEDDSPAIALQAGDKTRAVWRINGLAFSDKAERTRIIMRNGAKGTNFVVQDENQKSIFQQPPAQRP